MNPLISDHNINVIAELAMGIDYQDIQLHPSVIAYIQSLLEPIANRVAITDPIFWIQQVFPQNMEDALRAEIREVNSHNYPEDKRQRVVRKAVMDRIIYDLVSAGYYNMLLNRNVVMNPWNILNGILGNFDLIKLFGYTSDMDKLPMTISLNGTFYEFDMNMEQALGLLLFGVTSGFNFQIYVFGQILTPELTQNYQPELKYMKFNVDVGNQSYGFNTPEYMQGFQTGAKWFGVDHHRYWSNLRQITRNNTGGYTETPITF